MKRLTEDQLIARYFAPLASLDGAHGLMDDAATLGINPGEQLVVTADALVAGIHFMPNDPPDLIARKALRVNLSDLAAKGARPCAFMLCLALPQDWTNDWLETFAKGLKEDCTAFGFSLLGGDTVRTAGPLMIAVTAFGVAPDGAVPRRDGARPGDYVYVSGTIGDAALGLLVRQEDETLCAMLTGDERNLLLERYLVPQPRMMLADAVQAMASASMDVSDGLIGDLNKMLRASRVSASIDLALIPLSEPVRRVAAIDGSMRERALSGGDDYEILCTIPPDSCGKFEAQARLAGVAVTRIGVIEAGNVQARFVDDKGNDTSFKVSSFSHF